MEIKCCSFNWKHQTSAFFIFHKPCDLKLVCILVFFCTFAKDLGTEHNQRSLELLQIQ